MTDPKPSEWAKLFLSDDDIWSIVVALKLRGRYDQARASRLARFAANVRFQAACLDNVRDGFMVLDEDRDGNPVFMLTDEGMRVAREERDDPALRALLPASDDSG